MKDRIASLVLLCAVLLAGTFLFRHDDGSVIWGHLAESLARLGNLLRIVYVALLLLIITARFRPAAAAHTLRSGFIVLLIVGIYWNWQTLQSVPATETYRLTLHDQHTLLAHAESSPAEHERTHLAFYLALERHVAGRTVLVPEAGLLDQHYLTKVSRARTLVVGKYDAALTEAQSAMLKSKPFESRTDGRGRIFTIYTTPDRTDSINYCLYIHGKSYVLVPDGMFTR
ncbi:MAG: hypothetical protein HZA51_09410 [Planctomycetes bacterium]|nr:hypothetical protein [Planctomycetota bacterium]